MNAYLYRSIIIHGMVIEKLQEEFWMKQIIALLSGETCKVEFWLYLLIDFSLGIDYLFSVHMQRKENIVS